MTYYTSPSSSIRRIAHLHNKRSVQELLHQSKKLPQAPDTPKILRRRNNKKRRILTSRNDNQDSRTTTPTSTTSSIIQSFCSVHNGGFYFESNKNDHVMSIRDDNTNQQPLLSSPDHLPTPRCLNFDQYMIVQDQDKENDANINIAKSSSVATSSNQNVLLEDSFRNTLVLTAGDENGAMKNEEPQKLDTLTPTQQDCRMTIHENNNISRRSSSSSDDAYPISKVSEFVCDDHLYLPQ